MSAAGRAGPDVHEVIRAAAEEIRARPAGGVSDARAWPAPVAELIGTCADAVRDAVPKSCEFHGRRYYLRAVLMMRLEIFDAPASAQPLLCVAVGSSDEFGHEPGH